MKIPLILEVKGNSLDDGRGIRSVVFYKGCPLSCVWCHNPESKKTQVEISFDPKECINCGTCREVCPEGALSHANQYYIDRKKCNLCFLCVEACPAGALDRVGREMPVDVLLKKILPDKPFFDTSGGGVTLSGGEPTLFMEFTSQLLLALKRQNIHTLLETCGYFDFDKFMDKLYPHLDAIYYDIKIMDSVEHKKYCKTPNERILENFTRLACLAKQDGKVLLARTPLVPGITDNEKNLTQIASFLKNLNIAEAALLAYNPLWHEKSDKIGTDNPCKNNKMMASFSEKSALEKARNIFAAAGIAG